VQSKKSKRGRAENKTGGMDLPSFKNTWGKGKKKGTEKGWVTFGESTKENVWEKKGG